MSGYVPNTPQQQKQMLSTIGVDSIEQLLRIPRQARLGRKLDLPPAADELTLTRELSALAADTAAGYPLFRGAGAYRHFIPSAVRHAAAHPEFVTAYTPYQPEMSQGVLQAIFEFQTLIARLTGMDASNASVYDGATAVAEAAIMCVSATKREKFVVSQGLHPHAIQVLKTICAAWRREVIVVPLDAKGQTDLDALKQASQGAAGVFMQHPNYYGVLEPMADAADIAHGEGALLVASVNPITLGVLEAPAAYGADIAVGEGQPLGIPLSFGGPYLGFMATTQKHMRRLPGRIAGQTLDGEGRRAFVLTLQAREQHIRREKATSNICSNQALCALTAAAYLNYMGPQGLKEVGEQCYHKARYAYEKITALPGMRAAFDAPFFHEFAIQSEHDPKQLEQALLAKGIVGGLPDELTGATVYCVTEMNTRQEIDTLVDALREVTK